MAATRKAEVDIVAEAARRALDDANGDTVRAARMLETAVRAQSPLREALTEHLIGSACWAAIQTQTRVQRRAIWIAPRTEGTPRATSVDDRVVHLASGTLLMFPLPGGKRLADAKREEIAAAAEFYGRQASDMGAKARWLRLIAQSLPDGKVVGEVLTDERLRELQDEARAE